MKRTPSHKHFWFISALTYLVVNLLPLHLAVATHDSDCGPHVVISCDEHGDVHFIRQHVKTSPREFLASPQDESFTNGKASHDEEHVVEKQALDKLLKIYRLKFSKIFKVSGVFQSSPSPAHHKSSTELDLILNQLAPPLIILNTVRLLI